MKRSAIIQARVRPEIKFAGEQVLRSIGLTMTEAMELFLRRMIFENRLPFAVIALDDSTLTTIVAAWEAKGLEEKSIDLSAGQSRRRSKKQKRE